MDPMKKAVASATALSNENVAASKALSKAARRVASHIRSALVVGGVQKEEIAPAGTTGEMQAVSADTSGAQAAGR